MHRRNLFNLNSDYAKDYFEDLDFDDETIERATSCNLPLREVEMAIAVDKSFCDTYGNGISADARAKVESIIADVNYEYLMKDLCFVITIKHYEDVSITCEVV